MTHIPISVDSLMIRRSQRCTSVKCSLKVEGRRKRRGKVTQTMVSGDLNVSLAADLNTIVPIAKCADLQRLGYNDKDLYTATW